MVDNSSDSERERVLALAEAVLAKDPPRERQVDGRIAEIDGLLIDLDADESPDAEALTAHLLERRFTLLTWTPRLDDQWQTLTALADRYDQRAGGNPVISAAWAVVRMIPFAFADRDFDRAAQHADRLIEMFDRQPDTQDLTRFASQLLRAADWLLDARIDPPAVKLCLAVIDRLGAQTDSRRQVVATGAELGLLRAYAHLGDREGVTRACRAMLNAGELALTALDQAEARAERDGPDTHTAVGLGMLRVLVLTGLGRDKDARKSAKRLSKRFQVKLPLDDGELLDQFVEIFVE